MRFAGKALLLVIWSLLLSVEAANEKKKGFPIFYGSFEYVGENRAGSDVLPRHVVDRQLIEWTRGCPADAFVFIRDSNPFELNGMKPFQRAAENSLTRGTFLTEHPVNLREFGLDLEEYCEAEFIDVDVRNIDKLERYVDTRTRVFYVHFEAGTSPETKNETLSEILGRLPSPFVSIAYTSTFTNPKPIWRSVQVNPKRLERKQLKHKPDRISPIIAPLFGKDPLKPTEDPIVDLPDNFFLTLMVGSVAAVLLLVYRDFFAQPNTKPIKLK